MPTRRLFLAAAGCAGLATTARADAGFEQFLREFRSEALAAGLSRETIDAAFAGLGADPAVVAASRKQSEFSRPIGAYVEGAASAGRAAKGRALAARYADDLGRAEARFGVPGSLVLSLWAMESDFGVATGGFDTIRSLATLAAAEPSRALWRAELLEALRILQDGDVARAALRGSWAGAMGQTQFTPTSYRAFAVDGDGDGRRDIWGSVQDVLASISNFMAGHGWQRGVPWGYEVRLQERADLSVHRRTLAEWRALGFTRADGGAVPGQGDAQLFLPAGIAGPTFLLTANFDAIRAYNTSDAYALAAGRLADKIAGGGALARPWPRTAVLGLPERQEMHRRLAALGFYAGVPDGKFGALTRDAVRRFQLDHSLVPDGYADAAVLKALRAGPR